MTDRELLELAAKAAGISVSDEPPWSGYNDREGFYTLNMDGSAVTSRWNPLTDDGDALRLAVKLGLGGGTFRMVITSSQVTAYVSGNEGVDLLNGDDPRAATRRAIVRAAAEIGKTK